MHLIQLNELWAKTLCIIRDPQDIKKALKNSYMVFVIFCLYHFPFSCCSFFCIYFSFHQQFVAVLEQGDASRSSTATHKKLIGINRVFVILDDLVDSMCAYFLQS